MAKTFVASKTRSNRPGWAVTFRHPLRLDSQGRHGRKVRRGLGTNDDEEADRLVAQLNAILSDPSLWNATKRQEAESKFDRAIVAAFFDELQAGLESAEERRDRFIVLPGTDNGYSRVLFVGTTGAGKTTLLRQLIGSDPDVDRFPSTAPAKTTIADIEVVIAEGEFEAIVTFFSEFQVQTYVEECIVDTALALHGSSSLDRAAERFLNHRDQKFRLSYILGPWGTDPEGVGDGGDDPFGDDEPAVEPLSEEEALPITERTQNSETLRSVISAIDTLTKGIRSRILSDLGGLSSSSAEDQEALNELLSEAFETELHAEEKFHELTQDVMDLVRARFRRIEKGRLSTRRSEWPDTWHFKSSDRADFIKQIRWFSSNFWPHFGGLLTPIVDGIRVKGPLYSEISPEGAKLVLIDGQGLGHTPDEASSVTTHITKKFPEVDVILIVDNAQQPMQVAPLSVLKAVLISGYGSKVGIAFTHFDQIKGQNMRTMADRRAHVMASVMSALASLSDLIGSRVTRNLERGIDLRCFMLGDTHKSLAGMKAKAADYMRDQLKSLISFCVEAGVQREQALAAVVFDPIGIPFAIQDGVLKFNQSWRARLGLASYGSIPKEHWTKIKALNKRIAGEINIEYDNLRPVADLQTRLLEAISRYLDQPVKEDADIEQKATTRARQIIAARLLKLSRDRVITDRLALWRNAYNERGSGSVARRALAIATIFENAAPVPNAVMHEEAKFFVEETANIVVKAIEAVGGKISTSQFAG